MVESFTKAELIRLCATRTEQKNAIVEKILDDAFWCIRHALFTGLRVKLGNIGTVEHIATPARKARNPRTGQVIDVQPGHRVKFRASKEMRG